MGSSNSRFDEFEFEDLFCGLVAMGHTSSSGNPTGKRVLVSKMETANKTGVLSIADMDIKASSSIWWKITGEGLHLRLKTFDMSGNSLKSLPVEVYSMTNLKTLHASRCGLQRISDLTPLDKLTQLYLDKNDLEIDMIMPLPVSLQKLDLSTNHFSALPPVLPGLMNLTELNLAGNRIQILTGIGGLVSLVNLILDDNAICEVPEEAANLVKLRSISLKNNRITKRAASHDGQSIPAAFFSQTNVDTIDLSGNAGLTKADVMAFEGVDKFIERRKKVKDRSFQGGAMTDFKMFGLD